MHNVAAESANFGVDMALRKIHMGVDVDRHAKVEDTAPKNVGNLWNYIL